MSDEPRIEYRDIAKDRKVHWTRKPLYWLLFLVPSLPLILFAVPRAFTFMAEPTDPWYTRYTTPLFLITAIYVYPATAVSNLLGGGPQSPVWVMIVLLYTGAIGWGLCAWLSRRRAKA